MEDKLEMKKRARGSLIAVLKRGLPDISSLTERQLVKWTLEKMEQDSSIDYVEAFDLVCKEHPQEAGVYLKETWK